MPQSFSLTAEQQEEMISARSDQSRQMDGMAVWFVVFQDGNRFPYLSNDCRDRESALLGAIERFGARVKTVEARG